MDNATWHCWVCKSDNEMEAGIDRQKLTCMKCKSVYLVTGYHVDGRPMVALLEESDNACRLDNLPD